MSTTTNRGYTYPASTGNANLWTHFQTLATGIDTDVQALYDNQKRPITRLIQQVAQSLTSGTAAALTFGASSEDIDTHGFHDTTTNNTRITPNVAGYYRITGTLNMASATYSQLLCVVRKNGTNIDPLVDYRPDATAGAGSIQVTLIASANGSTDYFEFVGQQTSSGAQNTNAVAGIRSVFEVQFLRPL